MREIHVRGDWGGLAPFFLSLLPDYTSYALRPMVKRLSYFINPCKHLKESATVEIS